MKPTREHVERIRKLGAIRIDDWEGLAFELHGMRFRIHWNLRRLAVYINGSRMDETFASYDGAIGECYRHAIDHAKQAKLST